MAKPGLLNTGDPNQYKYGLQTDFNTQPKKIDGPKAWNWGDSYSPTGGQVWDPSSVYQGNASDDPDVAAAKNIANLEQSGRRGENSGFSYKDQDALMNQLKARINAKNQLGENIAGAQGQLNSQLEIDKYLANKALGDGLRNTRHNYAARGLSSSGWRQGAEQGLRGRVAGQLKGTMAADTSEFQTAVTSEQEQYGKIDLQTEAENIGLATHALDISTQNQIARAQAFQQLGQGLGSAAGLVAGSYMYKQPQAAPPVQAPPVTYNPMDSWSDVQRSPGLLNA